mmetsp:Transcript_54627/g.97109  ORF Transcript_54627/g.97109 Transcript_54627/m.97109 type:complete len:223 (+) Transcript_54627:309-977(+)
MASQDRERDPVKNSQVRLSRMEGSTSTTPENFRRKLTVSNWKNLIPNRRTERCISFIARWMARWLGCWDTPISSKVTTDPILWAFRYFSTCSRITIVSHSFCMPSWRRVSLTTVTLWTFSTLAAASSSCSRSLPSPAALPVDRHSKWTRLPLRWQVSMVGTKNMLSSSGWAVTRRTSSLPVNLQRRWQFLLTSLGTSMNSRIRITTSTTHSLLRRAFLFLET